MNTVFNHQAAALLPYYIQGEEVYFVFEEKSADYNPPFFDLALNCLGGNGIDGNEGSGQIVKREVGEEFFLRIEDADDVNKILGQKFLMGKGKEGCEVGVEAVREVGRLLLKNIKHFADYEVGIVPPVLEKKVVYGCSLFLRELDKKDFLFVKGVIGKLDGKLTTDNIKYGSRIVAISLDEINKGKKFAWAYGYILRDFLAAKKFGKLKASLLKEVKVERV